MTQSTYDEVPYPSLPIRRSHPSHLAAIARLFGMQPPQPKRCRVLELGCAAGGNLFPLAVDFPDSHFVGVDLSVRQIETGQATLRALGLPNLELHALDLNDVDARFGQFDFILCHGVFSWVPRPLQDKILQIGRSQLAENGILFVSYNTYPGWHLRGVVRDMMAFHVRDITDAATKVAQARALLDFLTRASCASNETYRRLLSDEAAILKSRDDGYLYHEHLEDVNEPLYFHEFLERVTAADLQYLGDTDLSSMLSMDLGDEVAQLFTEASLLQQEQYLDFLRNRMFRCSLLCRPEVILDRRLESARLTACDIGLEESLPLPKWSADRTEPFVCDTGAGRIRVEALLSQAALYVLNDAWPGCVPFDMLLEQSCRLLSTASAAVEKGDRGRYLARDLLTLYLQKLVRVWDQAPRCVAMAGPYPLATPLARWQAAQGTIVSNLRHDALQISDLDAHVLARLDGQHSRSDLEKLLADGIRDGTWVLNDRALAGPQLKNTTASQVVELTLESLARQALLIA